MITYKDITDDIFGELCELSTKKMTQKRIIIPPAGWWKPLTYYIVEAAFAEKDTIKGYIFFSGKLENTIPGKGNSFLQHFEKRSYEDALYLKALIELTDVNEVLQVPNRGKFIIDVNNK
jgi:hypothetical protein